MAIENSLWKGRLGHVAWLCQCGISAILALSSGVAGASGDGEQIKRICEDQRIEMKCQGGSACIDFESSWSVLIQGRVKQLVGGKVDVSKDTTQEVDRGLERLMEIENTACLWWNACMDMDTWANIRKQTFETMMLGLTMSKQRSKESEDLEQFLGALRDIENFYMNGIDEKFRVKDHAAD